MAYETEPMLLNSINLNTYPDEWYRIQRAYTDVLGIYDVIFRYIRALVGLYRFPEFQQPYMIAKLLEGNELGGTH